MNFENIYQNLPVFGQNAICSGYGYLLNRRRYGRGYGELERAVYQRSSLDAKEVYDFQCDRLMCVVKHAVATVPYYRELFASTGLSANEIQKPSDLSKLPLLSKSTVQENLEAFRSDAVDNRKISIWKTSGTTGTSLVFPMTLRGEQEQWATWWRYRRQFGIDHSTWYAHFYGKSVVPLRQKTPPFWRTNYPGRQILFSAYHMNDKNMEFYCQELNRRRPPWIQGYPSLLALLGSYMLTSGNSLVYRPRIVTVGAESLLPQQKEIIESAFGASCRQHYGTTEAVANISECPEGRLHVDEDFGVVEFVPNEFGELQIVATGFVNEAFVLLRYNVGDTVTLARQEEVCPCGNPGRVVESIDGRIEDYVLTAQGVRVGRLDHIVKDMVNVRECQIVQEEKGAIQFRVVRGNSYSKRDEEKLRAESAKRLGDDMRIDIVYVDALERTDRGKLRFVVSRLREGAIR